MAVTQPSGTPEIPLDALANAARVIGAVPRSVTPDEWFHIVCPQLLELIRSDSDDGLKRAAAYVVAELLAKKGIEEVVDREVVAPILRGVDPEYGQGTIPKGDPYKMPGISMPTIPTKKGTTSKALLDLENGEDSTPMLQASPFKPLISILLEDDETMESLNSTGDGQVALPLIPEPTLLSTLSMLAFLSKSHPTPLIPQRLLNPVLLPLWGLMSISREKKKAVQWIELPRTLLVHCIKTIDTNVTVHPTSMGTKKPIETILYNLSFTGGAGWEFENGELGGIEIRRRKENGGKIDMQAIDGRVEEFMKLVQDIQVGEDSNTMAALFLHILSDWLAVGGGQAEEDPVRYCYFHYFILHPDSQ